MTNEEISKASQVAYNAWLQAQVDAGVTCDADLSVEEKAKRRVFDDARKDTYTGKWPARSN